MNLRPISINNIALANTANSYHTRREQALGQLEVGKHYDDNPIAAQQFKTEIAELSALVDPLLEHFQTLMKFGKDANQDQTAAVVDGVEYKARSVKAYELNTKTGISAILKTDFRMIKGIELSKADNQKSGIDKVLICCDKYGKFLQIEVHTKDSKIIMHDRANDTADNIYPSFKYNDDQRFIHVTNNHNTRHYSYLSQNSFRNSKLDA